MLAPDGKNVRTTRLFGKLESTETIAGPEDLKKLVESDAEFSESVNILTSIHGVGLQTRLYFDDETEANGKDFVLNKIMDPRRRETLIARREEGPVPRYVLDIHLQGERETVFFDI